MESLESRTLISLPNWARMPPAALAVDPRPGLISRSTTATSVQPEVARFHARAVPMVPPPMIATSQERSAMGFGERSYGIPGMASKVNDGGRADKSGPDAIEMI